jgi:hypothetical protein
MRRDLSGGCEGGRYQQRLVRGEDTEECRSGTAHQGFSRDPARSRVLCAEAPLTQLETRAWMTGDHPELNSLFLAEMMYQLNVLQEHKHQHEAAAAPLVREVLGWAITNGSTLGEVASAPISVETC